MGAPPQPNPTIGAGAEKKPADSLADVNATGTMGQYPLVVVSNRLPVVYSTSESGEPVAALSPGGLVAAVAPALAGRDAAWVGWSGDDHTDQPDIVDGITVFPVPLSEELVAGHYDGLSNQTLWPLFHQVGVEPVLEQGWFENYRGVNDRFARAAADVAAPGGMVWVHDYHAMLVPRILRSLRPDVRIGYFHHIPFPNIDSMASLPELTEILSGVAAADVIGFQSMADAEHFRRAAPDCAGLIAAYPISIDYTAVAAAASAAAVQDKARRLREELGNPALIFLGADRIDYTKGIPERLEAYERALGSGRLATDDTVFVQAGSPSRESVESYQQLRQRVEETVDRINHRFSPPNGRPAVVYRAENLDREDLLALFVAADVMVVSSLRDGMNLVAKEYVACRGADTGVLVLSTRTGAADQMTQALLVDPSDIDALSSALVTAARMDPAESAARMAALRDGVRRFDVAWWSSAFLGDLASRP